MWSAQTFYSQIEQAGRVAPATCGQTDWRSAFSDLGTSPREIAAIVLTLTTVPENRLDQWLLYLLSAVAAWSKTMARCGRSMALIWRSGQGSALGCSVRMGRGRQRRWKSSRGCCPQLLARWSCWGAA